MSSILSKVFGRKKDRGEHRSHARQSRTSLLDGKFERVSPTVSPSVENFPDAGQRKELEKNNDFKLTLNLPGVKEEVGGRGLDTVFEAVPSSSLSERRLTPAEALVLLRACSQSIIAHGLETLGIMHPHWYSSSPEDQRRLISLFIHSLNPTTHSTAPTAEFESEVKYARSPHDVAAVLRWGLRHLQLDSAAPDFGKESGWYTKFSTGERQGNYSPRAFQELLVPLLPDPHRELLVTMLDTISSIASHSEANGISGSKLSKFIGLWFLTSQRVGDEDDFAAFYARWERMGRILEHLFLARIREESLRNKMPRRLTELVKRYPYSREPEPDLLPRPPFSTRLNDALYVRVETEIAPNAVPTKVHPLRVLAEALKAEPPANASEAHTALWEKLRRIISKQEETDIGRVFADDTVRLLALVPAHSDLDYATTRRLLLPTLERSEDLSTAATSPITSPISPPTTSFAAAPSTAPTSVPASPTRASAALPPNGTSQPLDWAQFSSAGFLESKDIAPLAATLLDKDVEVTAPPSRQSSRRRVPRLTVQSRMASPSRVASPSPANIPLPTTPIARTQAKTTQVLVRQLDEAFIDFWADGIVDPIAGDWPSFVVCRLREPATEDGLSVPKVEWVVIEHAYKRIEPPPPPPPVTEESVDAAASPRPSVASDAGGTRKRFSLWHRGSAKRNTSKAGKIGELGEIMSDGEEDADEEGRKAEPTKVEPVKEEPVKEKEEKEKAKDDGKKGKGALKFAGIKRKSVDIRRSLDVPSSPVPRKSSEVLPKADRDAKDKADREAAGAKDEDKAKVTEGAAAMAAGALAGAAAVVADAAAPELVDSSATNVTEPAADAVTSVAKPPTSESAAPSGTETLAEDTSVAAAQAADIAEPAPSSEPAATVEEPAEQGRDEDLVAPAAEGNADLPSELTPEPDSQVAASDSEAAAPAAPESVVETTSAAEAATSEVQEANPSPGEIMQPTEEIATPVAEELPAPIEESSTPADDAAEAEIDILVVEEEEPLAEPAAQGAVSAVPDEDVPSASPLIKESTPAVEVPAEAEGQIEEPATVEGPTVVEEPSVVEESAVVEKPAVSEEVAAGDDNVAEGNALAVTPPAPEPEITIAVGSQGNDIPAAPEAAVEEAHAEAVTPDVEVNSDTPSAKPDSEVLSGDADVSTSQAEETVAEGGVEQLAASSEVEASIQAEADEAPVSEEANLPQAEKEVDNIAPVVPDVEDIHAAPTEALAASVLEQSQDAPPASPLLAPEVDDAATSLEPEGEQSGAPAIAPSAGEDGSPADIKPPAATEASEATAVESTQVCDSYLALPAQLIDAHAQPAKDEQVELPPIPVVSSEPVPPANVPAVLDVVDVPPTPPAATEAEVPEGASDMPPAPESVVTSGATPGPQLALDSSEPVAAANAASEE
ncbi:hypothetical protein HDZ31DRAFT_19498, partial [Schizophyllum fasciatum]